MRTRDGSIQNTFGAQLGGDRGKNCERKRRPRLLRVDTHSWESLGSKIDFFRWGDLSRIVETETQIMRHVLTSFIQPINSTNDIRLV